MHIVQDVFESHEGKVQPILVLEVLLDQTSG